MFKAQIKYDFANKKVVQEGFDPNFVGKTEVIMCLGNGYLGIRSADEETSLKQTRNLFINGTFNKSTPEEVTELPNLADSSEMEIFLDGERVILQSGKFSNYLKALNVKTGLLERSFDYHAFSGKTMHFKFERFVSFANLNNLLFRMQVLEKNGKPFELRVINGINGRMNNSGAMHMTEGEKRVYDYHTLEYIQKTTESKIAVFHRMTLEGSVDGKPIAKEHKQLFLDRRFVGMTIKATVTKKFELTKFVTINSSVDNSEDLDLTVLASEKNVAKAREYNQSTHEKLLKTGWDNEFKASVKQWETDIWSKGKITIDSNNPYDQLAIDFARYHLAVFSPRHDTRLGIGAKGLSGEGYKGHSFWDTEMFMTPLYNAIDPEQAKKLLMYRYLGLSGARRKAKENHYEGAMYPWEAAWPTDGEVTPVWGGIDVVTGKSTKIWSGFIEQHIIADVAFALYNYYNFTHDEAFMKDYGYEILLDTAVFWTSRVIKTQKGYEIQNVIGPNEYKEHINNNSFTNYMAKWNIGLALKLIHAKPTPVIMKLIKKLHITPAIIKKMEDVCEHIVLNKPNAEGIIGENDTYLSLKEAPNLEKYKNSESVGTLFHDYNLEQVNQMQVSKQSDLILLFLVQESLFSNELKRKNFYYYEKRTTHDSSLSLSSHAILAADLREPLAYELFTKSSKIDLGENMKTSDHGIHAASIGGMVQIAIFGFGGVRIVNDVLRIQPNLPEAWNKLSFDFYYQNNRILLQVEKQSFTVKNFGNAAFTFLSNAKQHLVKPSETVRVKG